MWDFMEFILKSIIAISNFRQTVGIWIAHLGGARSVIKSHPLHLQKKWLGDCYSIPDEFDMTQLNWIIYHDFPDHRQNKDAQFVINAWSDEMEIVGKLCLFPPSILGTIRGELGPGSYPRYLRFPKELGDPTPIKKGNLIGCQFDNPEKKELSGWIWFHTVHVHRGGRLWDREKAVPLLQAWSPDDNSGSLNVHFV
jgi:hypothetical protein